MHAASLKKSSTFVKIKRIITIVAYITSLDIGNN